MLTWYDLLGLEAGAPAAQVRAAYQARLGQLGPRLLSGASTRVLRAADTARAAADAAWQVLSGHGPAHRAADGRGGAGGRSGSPAGQQSPPGWHGDRAGLARAPPPLVTAPWARPAGRGQ